jgi:hypothetical protein
LSSGKDCSTDIDECASVPCKNGATCIDDIAAFKCVCPPGLTGTLCEIDIDDCEVCTPKKKKDNLLI